MKGVPSRRGAVLVGVFCLLATACPSSRNGSRKPTPQGAGRSTAEKPVETPRPHVRPIPAPGPKTTGHPFLGVSADHKWWKKRDAVCPPGARFLGAGPPISKMVHCVIPTGPRHGPYAFFRGRTVMKLEEGEYRNGKFHGLRIQWYKNGRKKWLRTYSAGILHGRYATFYPSGRPSLIMAFKNGVSHGRAVSWHKNGKMASEEYFRNGKKNGLAQSWYDNGKQQEEARFRDGKRHGIRTRFYKNGRKKEVVRFVDDVRDGKWVFFHPNGKKKTLITYRKGRPHGPFAMWDPGGKTVGVTATWVDGRVARFKKVSR